MILVTSIVQRIKSPHQDPILQALFITAYLHIYSILCITSLLGITSVVLSSSELIIGSPITGFHSFFKHNRDICIGMQFSLSALFRY